MHLHLKKYVLLMGFIGAVLPLVAQTDTLCQSDPVGNYHVIGQANSTFFWDTQGDGVVLSGQGNDSVQINWNNGPGTYQLTVLETSSLGCIGLPVVLNIVVLDPSVSINGPPVCAADLLSYSFSVTVNAANLVTSAGTATNTGGDIWLIDGVPSGTDVILTVSTGSCSVNLTVNAPDCNCPPISPPTATNVSYCVGDAIPSLTASPPAGFEVDWYLVSSGGVPVLSNSNSYAPGVPGIWWVESRDPATGCVSSQRTEVRLIENALPLVTASPGTEICAGTSVLLTAGGAATYSWSPPGGLSAVSGNSVNASPTNSTTYTVVGTDVNGCAASATVDVDVNPIYSSSVSASICSGSSYILPDGSSVSASGSYPVTLTSVDGCDSVITTQLTVNSAASAVQTVNTCGSYTWINGITYTASTNTPTFTIPNGSINGCDSVITLNLTIGSFASGIDVQAACGSYIWIDGITYSASTNTPTFTIVGGSVNGCDSLVNLNLTIDYINFRTDSITTCTPYTWINGITYSSSTNTPSTVVFTTTPGACDTVVTLVLNIESASSTSITASICSGDSYLLPNGNSVNVTGSYPVTFTNVAGCDSVVTTNLTVLNQLTSNVNASICNGSSYTLPDGSSVNTAGSYPVTLIASTGCDSVVTTNLTVVNQLTSTVNASICNGSSYTLPDGSSVNAAGSYPVTLNASTGCDSVVTTNLTVVNQLTTTVNASICNGSSYTLPDGSSVSAAGSYPITLNSASGCDSVVTTILTIQNTVSTSLTASICDGENYNFNGQVLTDAGNYQATLTASSGCDSLINLTLSVLQPSETLLSAVICPGSNYLFNGSSYTSSGTYRDTLQNANGCDSIVVLNLGTYPEISVALNANICEGSSYILPNGDTAFVAGVYPVTLSSAVGCDSLVTVNLTVDPAINITLSDDVEICPGTSTNLTASGADFYLWQPTLGLSDSTGSSVVATPGITTNYLVYGNSGLCSDVDTVTVTVLPGPQLQIDPSAGAICLGDTLSLVASGADLLIWNDSSGVSLSCDTCATALAYPQESMTFILTGNVGQCSATTSVTVEVVPAVVAAISGDTTLCLGETVQLSASGGSSYNWSTGDSLAVVNVTVPASTFVTVEVSNGVCTDTATTALLVYPVPLVNAGEDTLIHYGTSAQLSATSNASGTWYPVNHLTCGDCLDPIADPPSSTTYCLTVVNNYGCAASDCIEITVDTLCADLFIPNVFAPDEGGHSENNCFKMYGTDCIGTMTLTIYNRWGEKVFVSSKPDDCWDGNYRGKPLNTGVYVYYLEAELITGESLSKQGNLTLMR